jgi:hypothetical protein
MMHLKAWGSTFVILAAAVGCGETSNFVGTTTDGGTSAGGTASGGMKSQAGSNSQAGTKSSAGTGSGGTGESAGTGSGGTSESGGTALGGETSSGGTGIGGRASTGCKDLGGNWQSCDNGVHRTEPGKCTSKLPRADAIKPLDPTLDECTKDSECTKQANGYCSVLQGGFVAVKPHNICFYGCTQDSDCTETTACLCGPFIGTCEQASTCKSDKDCSGGALCGQFDSCPGVPVSDFACTNPQDQCTTNADCQQANKQFCSVRNAGYRECTGVECAAAAGNP